MTEREKQEKGLLFNVKEDQSLFMETIKCQDKCHEFNQLKPSMWEERIELMKKILGKTGERFMIAQPFYCDYGCNIEIGEDFVSNRNVVILDSAKVEFGKNVFVGPNCSFYSSGHPLDAEQRNDLFGYAYPITVGDNVWFGGNVIVLPGVTVGNNCVIGAGSVVTKDVPADSLAAGSPCKVLREITSKDRMAIVV